MTRTTREAPSPARPMAAEEHVPWYIIVSKLGLALGTTLALLVA